MGIEWTSNIVSRKESKNGAQRKEQMAATFWPVPFQFRSRPAPREPAAFWIEVDVVRQLNARFCFGDFVKVVEFHACFANHFQGRRVVLFFTVVNAVTGAFGNRRRRSKDQFCAGTF